MTFNIHRVRLPSVVLSHLSAQYITKYKIYIANKCFIHSLHSLFVDAFGGEIGESHFKKRKRYLRLASDERASLNGSSAATFVADGNAYLKLALQMAYVTHEKEASLSEAGLSKDECSQNEVLILVSGTSFDEKIYVGERFELEQRKELQNNLDMIMERLMAQVDLDWMRQWSQRNPVGISGKLGIMESVFYRF